MLARPADVGEEIAATPTVTEPDQPIAAVSRGPEDGVVAAERRERGGDMTARDGGNVAAHDDHRAARARPQGAQHASADVATALADARQMAGPEFARAGEPVGRDGHYRYPAPIDAEPPRNVVATAAIETPRRRTPDAGRQAVLDGAITRRPHEYDQPRLHPCGQCVIRIAVE